MPFNFANPVIHHVSIHHKQKIPKNAVQAQVKTSEHRKNNLDYYWTSKWYIMKSMPF